MDIKQLRVRALRRLIGQDPLKEFAEKHDLDASYLSQILNGHRGMGEKAAAKMAAKIGVAESILVSPAFSSCLLYTSPSPRDVEESRMPSSA